MKKILVIADPYEADQIAYEKALKLAKPGSSKVHVAVICYESIGRGKTDNFDARQLNIKTLLVQHREKWWNDFLHNNPPPVEVSFEVAWEKNLAHWVLEHCKKCEYDLVVKTGNRSETPFYTPTDWQLFRQTTVPIYSVNDKPYQTNKAILVALDLATENEEKKQLNKRLLEEAFRLSVVTDSTLHCCHAIKIPTLVKELNLIDVMAHIHDMKKEARESSQEWLTEYDIDKKQVHIEEGIPSEVITDIARKIKAQCIIVGSMGRTGISEKLIGNTAEKVIRDAKSDLLVVRSEL